MPKKCPLWVGNSHCDTVWHTRATARVPAPSWRHLSQTLHEMPVHYFERRTARRWRCGPDGASDAAGKAGKHCSRRRPTRRCSDIPKQYLFYFVRKKIKTLKLLIKILIDFMSFRFINKLNEYKFYFYKSNIVFALWWRKIGESIGEVSIGSTREVDSTFNSQPNWQILTSLDFRQPC